MYEGKRAKHWVLGPSKDDEEEGLGKSYFGGDLVQNRWRRTGKSKQKRV